MQKTFNYLKNVRGELKHVKWPTKREISAYTVVVIAISLLIAGVLGLFDTLLIELIKSL